MGNGLFTWFVGNIDQEFVRVLSSDGSDVFAEINRGVHDRSYRGVWNEVYGVPSTPYVER